MDYDLIIIGSGPAGYVAGIRAGQIGLKTALIEQSRIGGMCLNWGCIPSKAVIESAKRFQSLADLAAFGIDGIDLNKVSFNWSGALKRSDGIVRRLAQGIEYLLAKNGVTVIKGSATVSGPTTVTVGKRRLQTKNILIASGSKPAPMPYKIPKEKVLEIPALFKLDQLPQNLVIVGSNAHAVELTQFFSMIGKPVVLLVPDQNLLPDVDPYLTNFIHNAFRKSKIAVYVEPKKVTCKDGRLAVNGEAFDCDAVINATQRQAVLPELEIGLELYNGFIIVNDYLQTSRENIYAVGDVNGRSRYAHTASAQGLHAVNVIGGVRQQYRGRNYPINIYTKPEMAQIGMTEPELKVEGIEYKVSEFPLAANGKALTEGQREGLIRLLSEKQYGEVLGVQIIATHATDMISEAAVLMQLESTVFDLSKVVHAHPTVSEIYQESGFAAFDQPIHK
ncbi:MAG: dihydrolipoyl dehydrogenase [Candidatus Neomarinimicrobiota bacterium]